MPKLRTLAQIEEDERRHPPPVRVPVAVPTMDDLRPGPAKVALLAFGDLLLALPRLVVRLFDFSLGIAILLGLLGCVVFGLAYLFG